MRIVLIAIVLVLLLAAGWVVRGVVADRDQQQFSVHYSWIVKWALTLARDSHQAPPGASFGSPRIEEAGSANRWIVSGRVTWRDTTGQTVGEPYTAIIENLCKAYADEKCWHLEDFALSEAAIDLADRTTIAARPEEPASASQAGGAALVGSATDTGIAAAPPTAVARTQPSSVGDTAAAKSGEPDPVLALLDEPVVHSQDGTLPAAPAVPERAATPLPAHKPAALKPSDVQPLPAPSAAAQVAALPSESAIRDQEPNKDFAITEPSIVAPEPPSEIQAAPAPLPEAPLVAANPTIARSDAAVPAAPPTEQPATASSDEALVAGTDERRSVPGPSAKSVPPEGAVAADQSITAALPVPPLPQPKPAAIVSRTNETASLVGSIEAGPPSLPSAAPAATQPVAAVPPPVAEQPAPGSTPAAEQAALPAPAPSPAEGQPTQGSPEPLPQAATPVPIQATPSPDAANAAMPTPAAGSRPDPALVALIQDRLAQAGYNPGPVDGRFGSRTEQALAAFERGAGLPHTGHPTQEDLAALEQYLANQRSRQPAATQPQIARLPAAGAAEAPAAPAPKPAPAAARSAPSEDLPAPSAAPAQPSPSTADQPGSSLQSPAAQPVTGTAADESLIFLIQHRLREAGYFPDRFDGRMSAQTASAIRAYQSAHGLPVNGVPSRALLDRLEAEVLKNRQPEDLGPTPLGALDVCPAGAVGNCAAAAWMA